MSQVEQEIELPKEMRGYMDGDLYVSPLRVCQSGGGYYLGRYCEDGPYSRESGYYASREAAELDLDVWRRALLAEEKYQREEQK